MAHFELKLITPEKIVFQGPVERVVFPGVEGDFGVLADHCPLVTTLRPGLVHIDASISLLAPFYVREGFVCVNEQGCVALVQDCLSLEEADLGSLESILVQKQQDIENAQAESDRAALQRDLQWVMLKRKIIETHRGL